MIITSTDKYNFKTSSEAAEYEQPLLLKGIDIDNRISLHINDLICKKPHIFSERKPYENAYFTYLDEVKNLNDYRVTVREYQEYGISMVSLANSNTLVLLSDLIEQIEKKIYIYIDIINRKENELSSNRITFTNFVLSLTAIIIALLSVA